MSAANGQERAMRKFWSVMEINMCRTRIGFQFKKMMENKLWKKNTGVLVQVHLSSAKIMLQYCQNDPIRSIVKNNNTICSWMDFFPPPITAAGLSMSSLQSFTYCLAGTIHLSLLWDFTRSFLSTPFLADIFHSATVVLHSQTRETYSVVCVWCFF